MTLSALKLNLWQSNVIMYLDKKQDDPDRVRPPQKGNDERRKGHRKKNNKRGDQLTQKRKCLLGAAAI